MEQGYGHDAWDVEYAKLVQHEQEVQQHQALYEERFNDSVGDVAELAAEHGVVLPERLDPDTVDLDTLLALERDTTTDIKTWEVSQIILSITDSKVWEAETPADAFRVIARSSCSIQEKLAWLEVLEQTTGLRVMRETLLETVELLRYEQRVAEAEAAEHDTYEAARFLSDKYLRGWLFERYGYRDDLDKAVGIIFSRAYEAVRRERGLEAADRIPGLGENLFVSRSDQEQLAAEVADLIRRLG